MSIVIHVGTHKTGTTALQRFASANRDELRERGLWYPSYTEIGLFNHYAHHHLAFAISDNDNKRLSEKDARRFIDHLETSRKPGETVLLSAEPLYRMILTEGRKIARWSSSSDLYWQSRDRFVARLREFFPFEDVEILICLRRQDSFARSVYQERIKVTKFRDSFSTFLHKDRSIFDYLGQVEVLSRHFPEVRIATFENLVSDGDLHTAFFGLLGTDISFTDERPVVNQALPIEFVELKRLVNKTEIDAELAKSIGQKLVAMATKGVPDPARNLDWLSQEDLWAFRGSFERDNEQLRRRFAPTLPSPLFPMPERTRKTQFTGLSPERAIQIAQHFFGAE